MFLFLVGTNKNISFVNNEKKKEHINITSVAHFCSVVLRWDEDVFRI